MGSRPRAVLLAPLLPPSARPQLRQPRRAASDARRRPLLARPRHRRVPPRRGSVPVRGGGHAVPEPSRHARLPQAAARRRRPHAPRAAAAGRGQPVADRAARLLRRRRRVPHVLQLPVDAAHVPGCQTRRPHADRDDPQHHARHPARLLVGAVPAQPRRVDVGDGHRRRARRAVHRVRRRSDDATQHRHRPPAGTAARQQPRADGAVPLVAAEPARQPGDVLRRRDRHGRQRAPRRPRQRAHPDAVDVGPQRRFLDRDARSALPAGDHRSGVRRAGAQRRGRADERLVVPALGAPHGPRASRPSRAGDRLADPGDRRQHRDLRLRARQSRPIGERPAVRDQPVRTRPTGVAAVGVVGRDATRRAARRRAVPGDRRRAVPVDAASARLLLVRAAQRVPELTCDHSHPPRDVHSMVHDIS